MARKRFCKTVDSYVRVEKYVDKGDEYKVTAWVKLIEPASSQLQLSTQVGDGSGGHPVPN